MTDSKNIKNINIYVLGCTKYAGLFGEFAERFKKWWGAPFFAYISPTPLEKWSDGVIDFLHSITDEHFILLHEDFYLTETPALERIDYLIQVAVNMKADRVSLMGNHSPERTVQYATDLYKYRVNQPYQLSFEASIQNRNFLLEHLKPGENPWEAEVNRFKKENVNGNIYTSSKPCIFYGDKLRRGELVDEPIDVNIF